MSVAALVLRPDVQAIGDPRFPRARFVNYHPAALDRDLAFAEVTAGKPRLWTLRDVWIFPSYQGVYDTQGYRLDFCNTLALPSDVPVRGVDVFKTAQINDRLSPLKPVWDVSNKRVVSGPVLYLGAYWPHYGHFLTDGMARLWAHLEVPSDVPRVLAELQPPRSPAIPWVQQILGALDLEPSWPAQPTLFKELIVPEPAMQSRYRMFDVADGPHLKVAERLGERSPHRAVYLSRAKLGTRLRDIPGEAEVEALFTAKGFDVVHPELMPLSEQISLFNSAEIIAGFGGSAFHTSLFSRRDWRGHTISINSDQVLSTRFLLIDALKGYESSYICAGRMVIGEDKRPRVEPDMAQLRAELNDLGI